MGSDLGTALGGGHCPQDAQTVLVGTGGPLHTSHFRGVYGLDIYNLAAADKVPQVHTCAHRLPEDRAALQSEQREQHPLPGGMSSEPLECLRGGRIAASVALLGPRTARNTRA